ncbi:MAG: hypothetical protein IJ180_08375 [Bacteroidales bacterium]|nr:hypothetical protein [Bacteroidales bacterium]
MKKLTVLLVVVCAFVSSFAQPTGKGQIDWGISFGAGLNLLNSSGSGSDKYFMMTVLPGAYVMYGLNDYFAVSLNPQYSPWYLNDFDFNGFMHYVDIPAFIGYHGERATIDIGVQYSQHISNSVGFYKTDKLNYFSGVIQIGFNASDLWSILGDNSVQIFRFSLGLNKISFYPYENNGKGEFRPIMFEVVYRYNISDNVSSSSRRRR